MKCFLNFTPCGFKTFFPMSFLVSLKNSALEIEFWSQASANFHRMSQNVRPATELAPCQHFAHAGLKIVSSLLWAELFCLLFELGRRPNQPHLLHSTSCLNLSAFFFSSLVPMFEKLWHCAYLFGSSRKICRVWAAGSDDPWFVAQTSSNYWKRKQVSKKLPN